MTIAAVKPTDIPRWASVAPGVSRTAPITSQMDNGWGDGERPAAEVQNWLQGVLYDWQQYLEDATDQLESSKINKAGATDLTGTLRSAADKVLSLGTAAQRMKELMVGRLVYGSPLSIAVAVANLSIDVATTSYIEATGAGGTRSIQTLTNGVVGQIVTIFNKETSSNLTLVYTGIVTADRFLIRGGVSFVLGAGSAMTFQKTVTGYWTEISRSDA